MKFLLDAQLPSKLTEVMRRKGYEAAHSTELSLGAAEDKTIWSYAKKNGYAICSKDEDFILLTGEHGSMPQFIWIRTGNCKNRILISSVMAMLPNAIELLEKGHPLVEIFREDTH
jgi:predicted nuclease of predicted toxin-antitoxin system